MFQVEWQRVHDHYYISDVKGFQFRKRIFPGGRIVYSIWQGGEMKYNTTIEHRFIGAAYGAVTNAYMWWIR